MCKLPLFCDALSSSDCFETYTIAFSRMMKHEQSSKEFSTTPSNSLSSAANLTSYKTKLTSLEFELYKKGSQDRVILKAGFKKNIFRQFFHLHFNIATPFTSSASNHYTHHNN